MSGISARNLWSGLVKLIFRNKSVPYPIKNDIRKILIYRCDAIGDFIVTTPVIQLIKENFPKAEVHFIVSPRNAKLLEHNNNVSKFFVYDGKFSSILKLIPKIRKEKYNIAFTFMTYKTSKVGTLLNVLLGSKTVKVAPAHKDREAEYSAYFNIMIPVVRNSANLVELQLKVVCDVLGLNSRNQVAKFDLPVSEDDRKYAEDFINQKKLEQFTVFNLSAGRDYNQWSQNKNIEFLKRLLIEFPDLNIVLIASASEAELGENIIKTFSGNIRLFPPPANLHKIIALIDKASIVISPDTAIVHIAAAKSVPVLAFYSGRTASLREWEPYGVKSEILISEGDQPIEEISTTAALSGFIRLYSRTEKI